MKCPPEWREAGIDAMRAPSIAVRLAEKQTAVDIPPAALLPSLVVAVAVAHATERLATSIAALDFLPVDMDGIERQLSDIAGVIQNR